MHFESLGHLAEHLAQAALTETITLRHGLERAAAVVEKTAKAEFGVYQKEAGPFQNWAELAESTKDDRVSRGYSENDPLLRKGDLRDSISHQVEGLEAAIGSTDPVMVHQEFGTSTIPPRAVLGPAVFRNKKRIKRILGAAVVSGMFGLKEIHPSLGYDMEVK